MYIHNKRFAVDARECQRKRADNFYVWARKTIGAHRTRVPTDHANNASAPLHASAQRAHTYKHTGYICKCRRRTIRKSGALAPCSLCEICSAMFAHISIKICRRDSRPHSTHARAARSSGWRFILKVDGDVVRLAATRRGDDGPHSAI